MLERGIREQSRALVAQTKMMIQALHEASRLRVGSKPAGNQPMVCDDIENPLRDLQHRQKRGEISPAEYDYVWKAHLQRFVGKKRK
ncbi:MAG: hypothetical protein JRH20_25465 [Deltaproteobacteria bacterium]|nr:hypothetical protein [Deltaproteobacteria bacterium]